MLFVFVAYSGVQHVWLYIWVTGWVSYKRQELLTLRAYLSSPPVFWWGPCCSSFEGFFCVVILCVFTFCVPCCDVRYDFRIKTMFGSSLPPIVCRWFMSYWRYLCLFAYSGVQHILRCVFIFVFCTLCCQFLWVVQVWLPIRYSLPFIYYTQQHKKL